MKNLCVKYKKNGRLMNNSPDLVKQYDVHRVGFRTVREHVRAASEVFVPACLHVHVHSVPGGMSLARGVAKR